MSWTFDIDGSVATNIQPTYRDNVSGIVTIPAKVYLWGQEYSVFNIAPHAFASCTALYGVVISEGVQEISSGAFYGCPAMGSIRIPSSVNRIKYDAFYCNYYLSKVIISDLAAWCNINFDDNANPLCYAHHLYLNNENNEVTDLTIPTSVTSVNSYAFHDCVGLTKVTIPQNVTSIGEEAFKGCTNLSDVSISQSVTSVGGDAFTDTPFFNGLSGLVYLGRVAYKYVGDMPENTEIVINDGTVTIGYSAFSYCTNLKNISLPESLTTIEQRAFQLCTGLTTINIPNGVKSIGKFAFLDAGLKNIIIPDSVSTISESAFAGNEDLTKVTLPEGVKTLDARAFNRCAALASINIPSTVTSIGEGAFCDCRSLTNLTIPGNVESIGMSAFEDCTGLTHLNMLEGVKSLGEDVFYNCANLESVVIPASVTTIGNYAFRKCTRLTEVYNYSPVPQTITEKTFSVYNDATLYVLNEYVNAYKAAEYWKDFNIVGVDFNIVGVVELDENSTEVPEASDDYVNIIVKRTLKGGQWNTICLPFNMSEEQVYDAFGDDVQLQKFINYQTVKDDATGVISRIVVNFEDVDLSEGFCGNYPYLIKTSKDTTEFRVTATITPDEEGATAVYDNGESPDLSGYHVYGTFYGTLHAQTVVPANCLFISENKFWYSVGLTKMKAFRAYFSFEDVLSSLDGAGANIQMQFNQMTGIKGLTPTSPKLEKSGYYTLDGCRLVGKPSKKGVYVIEGRKVVVK